MQETGAAPQKEEKDLLKIFGGVVLVVILLGVVAYGITPIRQSIISSWQQYEEDRKLDELSKFEASQPQGDLTAEEKLKRISE